MHSWQAKTWISEKIFISISQLYDCNQVSCIVFTWKIKQNHILALVLFNCEPLNFKSCTPDIGTRVFFNDHWGLNHIWIGKIKVFFHERTYCVNSYNNICWFCASHWFKIQFSFWNYIFLCCTPDIAISFVKTNSY